jgi:exodeoxyribonuclease VII large subunit
MTPQSFSLLELNEQVKESVKLAFSKPIWVRAEISELHENSSGHGYFELIEKEENSDKIIAKTKGNCWAFTYRMLKPYFESTTGEQLKAGLKVLISCTVEFHELYGISLTIKDIDPAFTLGDMARRRLEIIRRLQNDGVFDMNKQVFLPENPQRIAIISSQTAAGYGDFIDQLTNNLNGYIFYTKLFPAAMQGDQTVPSIIEALDKIYTHQDKFDAVVIIRGGGATAELSCFDNYDLAFNCTQFPLPIITGIGHQRDESILDLVAHTRAKTPTAVAEFLISCMDETTEKLAEMQHDIVSLADSRMQQETQRLQRVCMQFPNLVNTNTRKKKETINLLHQSLQNNLRHIFTQKNHQLSLMEKEVILSSPERLLKKGYSLTLKNGKLVKSVTELQKGDKITSHLRDGNITSIVS